MGPNQIEKHVGHPRQSVFGWCFSAKLAQVRRNFGPEVVGLKSTMRIASVPIGMFAAVAAAVAVSGCGLSTMTSGLSGSMFGAPKKAPEAVTSVTEAQLLSAAKAEYGEGGVNVGAVAHGCPQFAIAPAMHQATVYEPGRVGDSLGVVHRGEITRTARECFIGNGTVTVKYGFSGRVLLGPRGQSGRVDLPVNIVVAGQNDVRLADENLTVSADVTLENPIGYFSVVREVTFPVPVGSRPGEFSVIVGLKTPVAG
ncbi:MAG: hypothetical protein ACFCUN_03935 [Hyphomicrobiaceae bacterium]